MNNAPSKSLLDKFLALFTDVRPGEGLNAALLCFSLFLLFTAYYIMKPVREALILAGGSAELKSYAAAGQTVLLAFLVPLYALLASKMSRRRLINTVSIFFIACLPAFYLIAKVHPSLFILGVIFYFWIGIFNVVVIAQFWSFANDLYDNHAGKRLFPIVLFGSNLGAVLGTTIAGQLIKPLGVYQMLLVAAAILVGSLLLTNLVDTRSSSTPKSNRPSEKNDMSRPVGRGKAFGLVWKNHYILMIALLILVVNWTNTTGEYLLGRVVKSTAEEAVASGTADGMDLGQYIGKFYSDFFFWVNIIVLLAQLFLVSRVIKFFDLSIALLFLPIIAFSGYLILAVYPVLTIIRWVKTAENSTDYSLQNTVRHALFLPLTREEKYVAKQATDTFFWRAGDLLSAGIVFAGTTWFMFDTAHFAMFNMLLIFFWFILALLLGRANKRLARAF